MKHKLIIGIAIGATLSLCYMLMSCSNKYSKTRMDDTSSRPSQTVVKQTVNATETPIASIDAKVPTDADSQKIPIQTLSTVGNDAYRAWSDIKLALSNGGVDVTQEKKLITYLRESDDALIFEEIWQLLQVPDYDLISRNQEYLLSLLAVINTQTSINLFLLALQHVDIRDSNTIYVADKSLKKIAAYPENFPLLEQTFSLMHSDNRFLLGLVNGIARNAGTEQLAFLVTQIDAKSKKSPLVIASMSKLTDERLVPELENIINSRQPKDEVTISSVRALASMGQYEGTVALINWSTQQQEEQKDFVFELFQTAVQRSPSAYRAIEKQLNKQEFVSREIKEIIEEVYSKNNQVIIR
ncbi:MULTISPECIES: hypothetical protein [unclassified Photobacterium]|uniref:hypothetical protein n=1 Tax=unclassified Photobacterium TaxID=2628852 RepID=UPI001EE0AC86|nr:MULTISPECIES: hypothetical protein [unclassified Photobacterium]MCG3864422.1 hypothetical protein [Photobacterium sp. Ph6]MCG3875994.1 hypothetical protein [Photobacterium sp. Ph5]